MNYACRNFQLKNITKLFLIAFLVLLAMFCFVIALNHLYMYIYVVQQALKNYFKRTGSLYAYIYLLKYDIISVHFHSCFHIHIVQRIHSMQLHICMPYMIEKRDREINSKNHYHYAIFLIAVLWDAIFKYSQKQRSETVFFLIL